MKTNFKFTKKILSVILCLALLMSYLPLTTFAAEGTDKRIVDADTLNYYENLFYNGNDPTDTYSAGAVWTDKSVLTDATKLHRDVTMTDPQNNFLVALSAIASNKEIIGYSAIPTDTILILDASSSMSTSALSDMVTATNAAIKKLNETSNHNRVGVVIYDGESDLVLPVDRYTPASNGNFFTFNSQQNKISVASGVKNSSDQNVTGSKTQGSGTYTQGGIYTAMQEFLTKDTTIASGQIQGGTSRKPIFVLMTDGDPSYSASNFTNATNANINSGYIGPSNKNTFYTMLTAAYAKNVVSSYYNEEALFYTLGYDIDQSSAHAPNILNPSNMTSTFRGYANTYLNANVGTTVTFGSGSNRFTARRINEITSLEYADESFTASGNNLTSAFEEIIEEIIIQSRYYATHIKGIDPDFDGYLTFEDKLGDYMELKDIKGIMHGVDYFTGAILAKMVNADDMGTITNPTEFGTAFRDSVKTRLGIKEDDDAFALIGDAYEAKQLNYVSDTNFSNWIGWYSNADGSYAGFWNEGVTDTPEGAVYKNKSYGFYGAVNSGTVKKSDMMFMSIMVRTEIQTGEQTVIWRIPASLMPMVTYKVALDGTEIATADVISLEVEETEPVRLIYETGLNGSIINELNVKEVMAGDVDSAKHIKGNDYVFWTNYFDKSADEHDDHISTISNFIPNVQNERYYYTEDTPIYIKEANGDFTLVTDRNHSFEYAAEKYYHLRYSFSEDSTKPIKHWDEISEISLGADMRKYVDGQWYIKQGTVYRIIYPTAIVPKSVNATESIIFSHLPFITIENGVPEATVKLGNNGRTSITPATGIKLSKTLESGVVTDRKFKFEVTLSNKATASEYEYVLADLDSINGEEGTMQVQSGNKLVFELAANKTIWFKDIPADTEFTIKEISDGYGFEVESVSVDGKVLDGNVATGTVKEFTMSDVDFVNGIAETGALSISKAVTHPFGNVYTVPSNLDFDVKVKLISGSAPVSNYEFTATIGGSEVGKKTNSSGEVDFTIKDGETILLTGLPEDVTYTVSETNIPSGFTLKTPANELTGTINERLSVVNLVNDYTPQSVSPKLELDVTKLLAGREWLNGEKFTFSLRRSDPNTVNQYNPIRTIEAVAQNSKVEVDLSGEVYDKIGTYRYILTENTVDAENGITYDTLTRQFTVTVTDSNMDGKLEISSVSNVLRTEVTGNSTNGYNIEASVFNNSYAPVKGTTVKIPVKKLMDTVNGGRHTLNGFKFGLYDANNPDTLVVESTATNLSGDAEFEISYSPDAADDTFRYVLKEIDNGIPGITYDNTVYTVEVEIIDNLDGSTSNRVTVKLNGVGYTDTVKFTNLYTPTPGTVTLDASKILKGRELNAEEFEFTLLDKDRNTLQTKKNRQSGFVLFDPVTIDNEKVYEFYIVEKAGSLGGVTYSTEEYKVEVHAIQNGSDYVENGIDYYKKNSTGGYDPVDGAEFTNSYKAAPTKAQISGTKNLNGRNFTDSEFEFILKDENGGTVDTASNIGNGFTFDEIVYDTAGVYKYTVSEVSGNKGGVTYDTNIFDVTVTVHDDGLGHLHTHVNVVSRARATDGLIFYNTYRAAPVTDDIDGLKVLENKKLSADEFEFKLINVRTNEVVQTVKNKEDGTFIFEDISFNTAGEYFFEVVEDDKGEDKVSYDNTVYALKYVIKDDGTGQLKIDSKTIMVGEQHANSIVFTNTYNPENAILRFDFTKTLINKSDKDMGLDGFKFKISADDMADIVLETDEEGKAATEIVYTLADKDKNYTYKITEVDTGIHDMTYDDKEVTVTVNVTLSDDGELLLAVTQDNEAVEGVSVGFENTYEPKLEPIPETPTDIVVESEPKPVSKPESKPVEEKSPKTGDGGNLFGWFAVVFVSGTTIFTSAIMLTKKKKTEE